MIKEIQGKCTLFESVGGTFICEARYSILIDEDEWGAQDNTGYLFDIERPQMASLQGRPLVLKLEDDQALDFYARDIDTIRGELYIRINSVINDNTQP